jgi:hypothetical protein
VSFLLAALLLLASPGVETAATASAPDADPSLAGLKGADLDLLSEVRRIGERVASLRGEAFRRPPLAVRVPEDMLEVAATIRAYSVLTPDRLEARGRAWADLGLGEVQTPSRLLVSLAADLAGIGFDPAGNRLLVTPDLLTVDDFEPEERENDPATVLLMTGVRPDEPLVCHLLMHVRQRERRGGDCLQPTTDAMLAAAAWAEGEANLVAIRHLFTGLGLSEEILQHRIDPGGFLNGILLPPELGAEEPTERAFLEFVYLDGFDAVLQAYRAGGWSTVDEAMARRKSTRQMLHPAKSAPQNDFATASPPAGAGLTLADEDVLGEQAIVVLISQGSGKDNLGLIAGDGWAGGRVYRWETESDGGSGITQWITRWESPQSSADFLYSFARSLAERFPGRSLEELPDGRRRMEAGERVYLLEPGASEVRILVVPPDWVGLRAWSEPLSKQQAPREP